MSVSLSYVNTVEAQCLDHSFILGCKMVIFQFYSVFIYVLRYFHKKKLFPSTIGYPVVQLI